MSSVSSMFEVGAVSLGYVGLVASWRRPVQQATATRGYGPLLIVQCSAVMEDAGHEPAQSVSVNSREGLLALRSAIDEALKEPAQ